MSILYNMWINFKFKLLKENKTRIKLKFIENNKLILNNS